jgi:hypothetical protein
VAREERLGIAGVAKFTVLVGLAGIFIDASIGHGLTWENDPYWTYWVTKTFLIATIFGLGTAWFGIGPGRGAVITAIHTLVLTIYYWTLSPIGLPSTPTWLDFEHTWITGLPIHFGVIYVGYLLALWAWRRRRELLDAPQGDSAALGTSALLFGVGTVVVAGGLSALAIGEFPGFTWFLVRLLITVPFLIVWWGLFGRDLVAGIVGGVILSLIWATYSQFVGPVGLPGSPLRILDPAPPPVTVRWLDYRELWLLSLPIYLIVMLATMVFASGGSGRRGWRLLAPAALVPLVLLTTAFTIDPQDRGVRASFSASGDVELEDLGAGTGEIQISATDMGDRVTALPPHDRLLVDATIEAAGHRYALTVRQPIVEDPLGEGSTWWGVAFGVEYRAPDDEATRADLVGYGLGDLSVDGELVGRGLPVEIVASRKAEYALSVEIGNDVSTIPGHVPELRATWASYTGSAPEALAIARYVGGGSVLVILLVLGLMLEARTGPTRSRQADRTVRE